MGSKLMGDRCPMPEWCRCGLYQASIQQKSSVLASARFWKVVRSSSSHSSTADARLHTMKKRLQRPYAPGEATPSPS